MKFESAKKSMKVGSWCLVIFSSNAHLILLETYTYCADRVLYIDTDKVRFILWNNYTMLPVLSGFKILLPPETYSGAATQDWLLKVCADDIICRTCFVHPNSLACSFPWHCFAMAAVHDRSPTVWLVAVWVGALLLRRSPVVWHIVSCLIIAHHVPWRGFTGESSRYRVWHFNVSYRM